MKKISQKLYNYVWAVFLMTPIYMIMFDLALGVSRSNFLVIIAAIICLFIILAIFLERKIYLNRNILIIILMLAFIFVLSIRNFDIIDYSFIQFGFYIIIPALLVFHEINIQEVLRYLIYLSFPLILGLENILTIQNYGISQADMYNVYAMVPCILASLIHFFHYREQSNIFIKIGYLLNLYYLFRVGINAVRGFWLVFLFFVAFEIMFMLQKNNSKKNYDIIVLVATAILVLVILNLSEVLMFAVSTLQNVSDIELGILTKTVILLERGDISNGRFDIWENAINCFLNTPILGAGIDGIAIWSNGTIAYPHNFILQLLVDGGILFGIFPIAISLIGLYNLVMRKVKNNEIMIFSIFLTSASIPIALLSGDIWKSSTLWLTIFFYAKYIVTRKVKRNE